MLYLLKIIKLSIIIELYIRGIIVLHSGPMRGGLKGSSRSLVRFYRWYKAIWFNKPFDFSRHSKKDFKKKTTKKKIQQDTFGEQYYILVH